MQSRPEGMVDMIRGAGGTTADRSRGKRCRTADDKDR